MPVGFLNRKGSGTHQESRKTNPLDTYLLSTYRHRLPGTVLCHAAHCCTLRLEYEQYCSTGSSGSLQEPEVLRSLDPYGVGCDAENTDLAGGNIGADSARVNLEIGCDLIEGEKGRRRTDYFRIGGIRSDFFGHLHPFLGTEN